MGIIIYLLSKRLAFGIITTAIEVIIGAIAYFIIMLLAFKDEILTEGIRLVKKYFFAKTNI